MYIATFVGYWLQFELAKLDIKKHAKNLIVNTSWIKIVVKLWLQLKYEFIQNVYKHKPINL